MELNVTILNILRYEDKTTKEPKIRIGYINNDKAYIENTAKVKGLPELSVYIDDKDLWDKLDVGLCGRPCTLTFDKKPNPRNPLKDITILTKISSDKYGDISIL